MLNNATITNSTLNLTISSSLNQPPFEPSLNGLSGPPAPSFPKWSMPFHSLSGNSFDPAYIYRVLSYIFEESQKKGSDLKRTALLKAYLAPLQKIEHKRWACCLWDYFFTRTPNVTFESLQQAVINGDLEQLKKSISQVGDPTRRNTQGQTLLHLAALHNHPQIITYLVQEVDFSLNLRNHEDELAITVAVANNNEEAVDVLSNQYASLDEKGLSEEDITFLEHGAATHKNLNIFKWLKERLGLTFQTKDCAGDTPADRLLKEIREDPNNLN